MSATAAGWLLLALTAVMMLAIVWPMLDDAESAAEVYRIEGMVSDRALDYQGRHRLENPDLAGTVAQRRPSRAFEQRWNAITQPMPVVDVPIVAVLARPAWPTRQSPTDLADAYELAGVAT